MKIAANYAINYEFIYVYKIRFGVPKKCKILCWVLIWYIQDTFTKIPDSDKLEEFGSQSQFKSTYIPIIETITILNQPSNQIDIQLKTSSTKNPYPKLKQTQ